MREIPEAKPTQGGGISRLMGVALVAAVLGAFAGANLFPVVETNVVEKRVDVPVEVIKYVDRVVEKRVEVPVEVIKFVDRMVEKPVVVEKRIEVPVEKIVYRSTADERDPLDNGHLSLRVGMRKSQVFGLVGRPYFDDGQGDLHYYSVSSRMNLRLKFDGEELIQIIHPK
jgi:hypothetical protein